MFKPQSIAFYSTCTSEDFLQDDYFISSIKNPTEESIVFWKHFEENNKNTKEYSEAILLLQVVDQQYKNSSVSNKDFTNLWSRIEESNAENTRAYKRRKITYAISAIAATIAILLVAVPILKKAQIESEKIMTFAKLNSDIDLSIENIQLIISEQKTVELCVKESSISIDSADIKIDEQGISLKESAEYNQLIVPRGKRSRLTLADGSQLHVNSGTRVVYPINFSSKLREIYVDGEVLLDVKKDPERPFIVRTSDLSIEVLGTRFNVMAYENEENKQIVLANGSVKVSESKHRNSSKILKPSEMFEIRAGVKDVRTVEIDKHLSWTKGIYHYKSERLEEIVKKLSRYYGVDVVCGQQASNYVCSGKIDIDNSLDEVLNSLSYVLPLKIEKSGKRYIIS